MQARYKFDEKRIADMPLTIEMTATVAQWRDLAAALSVAEKDREERGQHADPIRPLTHCITNLLKAVDDAAGCGYKSRGYSWDYQKDEGELG